MRTRWGGKSWHPWRRPGKNLVGFHKALAKLPMAALRGLAQGVRWRLLQLFGSALEVEGFVPLGVDGSRLECPRSAALEQRLPQAGKTDSAPTVWVTGLMHLGLGLLWAWRLGRGTASERDHLVANVLDPQRLPARLAGKFYRWRWANEGLFRTYKRTLSKVKLMSRKVGLVHREAEVSLLATQLLLALGAWAVRPQARPINQENPEGCSPRQVLLAIRAELYERLGPRQRSRYEERLAAAAREHRLRSSAKTRRSWPRRKDHDPPKPPNVLTLTARQKARILRLEKAAA